MPVVLHSIRSIHPGANSMRNARRLTMMGLLLSAVLLLAPNSWAQQRPPILEQIAKTYGIDSWDKVEAIRYTWNGEIPGLLKLLTRGSGSPRPARSLTRGRIKTESRLRSPTTALSSAANPTRRRTKSNRLSSTTTIGSCFRSTLIGIRAPP